MRDILFRGKRANKRKWIEGNLITGVFTRCGQDIPYILNPDKADYDCFEDFSEENGIFEVDPSTVCQYTGLSDKNGRKIFEGDIVRLILPDGEIRHFKVSIKSVVRKVLCHPDFDDEFSKVKIIGVVFEWNGYELFPCVDTYGVPDYKMMEVIGNIYDNQEMLT